MITYYHGGKPGLTEIRPASETGERPAVDFLPDDSGLDVSHVRRDRIFLGTDVNIGMLYAALFPNGGSIYVVDPEGPIENDPDYHGTPGESVMALRATVVAERRLKRREWEAFQFKFLRGVL